MSNVRTTSQNAKLIIPLSIIFFTSFVIRLIGLNQSLWLDEATTARVLQQYNFVEIITKFSPSDFHPPLYYLFMKLWTNIFGYTEVSLRLPSTLFSLLSGYFVFKIAKLLYGYIVAMWSAIFFLFNPLIIYYSQEARMYMMATFLLTVSLYSLLTSLRVNEFKKSLKVRIQKSKFQLKSQNWKSILLYIFFISLSFLTFYGSIFLIIPMLVFLLYKKKLKFLFVSCLVFGVVLLILSPLLLQQIINAKQQLWFIPNWSQVLGTASLKNLFLIPIKFSIGRISFYPKWLYWIISAIWTSFIWIFVIKGGLKDRFLFFLFIGSLGFGILFSFFTPLLQYFRFLYLIPLMSLMLALGSAAYHRFGVIWLILTGYLVCSSIYLLNPNFHREDWKSLAKNLTKNKVYMVYLSSDAVSYYRKDIKTIDLKTINNKDFADPEIVIIPYTADIHGIEYQKILSEKNYKLEKKEAFRGLTTEIWRRYSAM